MEKVFKNRKSCREFSDEKVPDNHIGKIMWAGSRAPYASGGPRRLIVSIRDKETKLKLQEACVGQKYVGDCDTIFIAFSLDFGKVGEVLRSGRAKGIWDCGATLMCMDIMATSLGLGTCWIGNFFPDKVREILNEDERPEMILVVGHPKC